MAVHAVIEGIAHLRRAGQVLAVSDADEPRLRHAVLVAAREFWAAAFYSDQWPPAFQEQRDLLFALLLRGNIIDVTVRSMQPPELGEARQQLLRLVEMAEASSGME